MLPESEAPFQNVSLHPSAGLPLCKMGLKKLACCSGGNLTLHQAIFRDSFEDGKFY